MLKHSKKYREASVKIVEDSYSVDAAIALVRDLAFAKFDETIEIAVKLNLKKGHSVRDTVVLPHQFRTESRILVFAQGEKAAEALEAGADHVGGSELVAKIQGGWLDFDVCVATPEMMREVGRLGQILGRRGLMPNPRTKTVTMDIKGILGELKKGRVEFRADKGGVVHFSIGKCKSMDVKKVKQNFEVFFDGLKLKRPSDVKGEYIQAMAIASTMGPGVRVSLSSLL